MAGGEKTLEAMRANPRDDWRMEQLESVAASFGLNCRKPGSSHLVFEHPAVIEALSVPARRPINRFMCSVS